MRYHIKIPKSLANLIIYSLNENSEILSIDDMLYISEQLLLDPRPEFTPFWTYTLDFMAKNSETLSST